MGGILEENIAKKWTHPKESETPNETNNYFPNQTKPRLAGVNKRLKQIPIHRELMNFNLVFFSHFPPEE